MTDEYDKAGIETEHSNAANDWIRLLVKTITPILIVALGMFSSGFLSCAHGMYYITGINQTELHMLWDPAD